MHDRPLPAGSGGRRPIIGIPCHLEPVSWRGWIDRPADFVPHGYVSTLQAAGASAVLIPPDDRGPGAVLGLLDGVLLAGGADIDASFYTAQPPSIAAGSTLARDRFEIELARAAAHHDLPMLGVCRGMQILNVATGGTLIAHLPDVVGHDEHRAGATVFTDHAVRLAPRSRVADAIGATTLMAKSLHHQGIDRLGAGAEATGWCERDGTVEAIEFAGRRFAVGVLWHPEQEDELSALLLHFVEVAADSRARDAQHVRA